MKEKIKEIGNQYQNKGEINELQNEIRKWQQKYQELELVLAQTNDSEGQRGEQQLQQRALAQQQQTLNQQQQALAQQQQALSQQQQALKQK